MSAEAGLRSGDGVHSRRAQKRAWKPAAGSKRVLDCCQMRCLPPVAAGPSAAAACPHWQVRLARVIAALYAGTSSVRLDDAGEGLPKCANLAGTWKPSWRGELQETLIRGRAEEAR